MASIQPGPLCQAIGITAEILERNNLTPLTESSLKNGHVLELKQFCEKSNKSPSQIITWIRQLHPESTASLSTLKYQISRTYELNKKLNSKKKVKEFKSAKEFKEAVFDIHKCAKSVGKCPTPVKESTYQLEESLKSSPPVETIHWPGSKSVEETNPPPSQPTRAKDESSDDTKELKSLKENNLLRYDIIKQQKRVKLLQTLISAEKENLNLLKERKGHYSVRNVKKRDIRAKKTRQELNGTKTKLLKCKKVMKNLRKSNQRLKTELVTKINESDNARRSIMNSEEHVQQLLTENENLKCDLQEKSLVSDRKDQSKNYYKRQINKFKTNGIITQLKKTVSIKEKKIQDLEERLYVKSSTENDSDIITRSANGSFTNNIRLCVIELAALEVAVQKIPSVIKAVSVHMFAKDISTKELPTKSSVQTIIDEGHYIAKRYIVTKIDQAESLGINRDGTTRKKQKILDTAVTLDTGEVMSLGFTRVSRETSKVINETTKLHFEEMSSLQSANVCEGDFVRETLEKMSFSMSDRASNEKAANRLLDEWRDDVLGTVTSGLDTQRVLHFHCMAHVLLGFHKYSSDDVKKLELRLASEKAPLGRDSLPRFKYWKKTGTVAERTVRTTSEVFGPSGNHYGLRDRWEAHCSEKGIKSTIGNYKDNRFNGLFQTAAEVLLHAEDMLHVLDTVPQGNGLLVAVKADLQDPDIRTILRCYALFYIKVTGPYWSIVTSSAVPYLLLNVYIQKLASFLDKCVKDPATLMTEECWPCDVRDEIGVSDIPSRGRFEQALAVPPEDSALLLEVISVVSSAMLKCVEKQLEDFLPGGQFSSTPTKEDLRRTSFSHTTNLGCEHHFGDLDSSQKRRPNASMHHHSTIQILKRNRKRMMEWLSDMSPCDKDKLMKDARKSGKILRQEHLEQEKNVLKEIHNEMESDKDKKKGKKRKRQENDMQENDIPGDFEETCDREKEFAVNEYIIVAYQDGWYPGVVECVEEKYLTVNFLASTNKKGNFTWPARKDVQKVSREFVIKRDFVPECKNSGRMWHISDHESVSIQFTKYCKVYF